MSPTQSDETDLVGRGVAGGSDDGSTATRDPSAVTQQNGSSGAEDGEYAWDAPRPVPDGLCKEYYVEGKVVLAVHLPQEELDWERLNFSMHISGFRFHISYPDLPYIQGEKEPREYADPRIVPELLDPGCIVFDEFRTEPTTRAIMSIFHDSKDPKCRWRLASGDDNYYWGEFDHRRGEEDHERLHITGFRTLILDRITAQPGGGSENCPVGRTSMP